MNWIYSLTFKHPYFLTLLALIPLFWIFDLKRRRGIIHYSSTDLFTAAQIKKNTSPFLIPRFLRSIVFAGIILALARPQEVKQWSEQITAGIDIILTIDTSRSMQAQDFEVNGQEVNRLMVVKQVVSQFIERRKTDRIGMVVFGDLAFTQSPLTLDYPLLLDFLKKVQIGIAGDGTAIGDGLALSVKRLKDLKSASKIIILLTDGTNTSGELKPEEAADLAAVFGIKVYTVGVGSQSTELPILVPGPFGSVVQQTISAEIDEETLKKISEKTHGQYFRATNTESLQKIYQTIDQMEKTEAKVKQFIEVEERYLPFVLIAIAAFLLELFLKETLLKTFP